jgi:hypothetical protein
MARKKTATRKAQPNNSVVDQLIAASKRGPSGFQFSDKAKADIDAVANDPRIKSGEAYVSAQQVAKFLREKYGRQTSIGTLVRKVKEHAGGAL